MIENKEGVLTSVKYSDGDIIGMLRDLPDACCIFEVITDPFGTVKDMQFLFVNEKYASLVGKSTAELIGATYFNTVVNRDEDWIRLSYQAAIMRQSVINRTYNTQYGKWFEFWAVPVYKKGYCAYIIHDVTAEKRKEESRELDRNSNNLILECAKILSANEFRKGVRDALQALGTEIKADRLYIIESKNGEPGETYEWVDRKSGTGLPSKKDFERFDFFTMWNRQLQDKSVLIVYDTKPINELNSEVYSEVLAGTISRFIVVPLKDKNDIIGYLVADNFSMNLDINLEEVVESVSIFMAEELRNYRLQKEMTYMTTHDILTDLGNRHSFNASLHMLEGMEVPIGVCFIDINGLKATNDKFGHDAGDKIIKEAAENISSIFKKKYCYRIGGDEFVVLVPQITEKSFNEHIEKLKKKANKVPMAIGYVWKNVAENVSELVNTADSRMYADKAEYYKKNNRRKE